jgi:uncharacterized protein
MADAGDRIVQFVIKISKLCNLRCRYCYEMNELDQPRFMSLDELRQMYRNIREYYVARDAIEEQRTEIRFIWHGGEPLLVEPQHYWDTFSDQREILGPELAVSNTVQTNLTILDDERLRLLRDGFESFGVSVDVFGGLRVNLAGRDQQARILRNMDIIRAQGLRFGGLTVLTKKNVAHVRKIFRFYERAGIGFRLLPLFDGAFDGQHAGYELTTAEIVDAFRTLIDLWLESDAPPEILPLNGYLQTVTHALTEGAPPRYFNKREWNPALLVNINGDLFHTADPYGNPDWALGNILTTPLSEIMVSSRMEKSLRAGDERMALNCTRCRFFGSCSGYPIVEEQANSREQTPAGIRLCVVEKQTLEHIELRLRQAGIVPAAATEA